MSQSILPNARFLGLSSQSSGRDWDELIPKIDQIMDEIGLSLAEETIVLIFSQNDNQLLEDDLDCRVCRPVTGPKRQPPEPFLLEDWEQKFVHSFSLETEGWEQVSQECLKIRAQLAKEGKKLKNGFLLLLKRRLVPELKLSIEAIFYE